MRRGPILSGLKRYALAAAVLCALFGAHPAAATPATGAVPTYTVAGPKGTTATVPAPPASLIGLENGSGVACIIGSDTTCELPGSGGGGGSNPAASATGAAVPADAGYTGLNFGGNLIGWTGDTNGYGDVNVENNAVEGSVTSTHTCSTAGYTIIGCIGQLDDDAKGSIPAGGANIGTLGNTCTSVLNISQTTTTDVLTSTAKLHICSIVLVASAAMNIGIDEGSGTTCESSGTALIAVSSTSSATPTMPLAANGGFSAVSGEPWMQTKTTGDHLCVLQGTGTVAGTITYSDY